MKYFSMFSGIGGFELGIQRAFSQRSSRQDEEGTEMGKDSTDITSESPRQSADCIGYSEIDKYAIKTYEEHYEHRNYGDATTIDERTLPDFALLVGGFPCQAFSVAGKRRGFEDTRGTLFFDIARILQHKRPRHLVLENVKGLLSHDSGKTFQTILGVLTDLGYSVEWQVLNSKDFGVPQNRERVFIVGHLGGECGRKVFPLRKDDNPSDEGDKGGPRRQVGAAVTVRSASGNNARGNYVAKRHPLRFLGRNQKKIEGDYAFTVDASQTSGIRIREATKQGFKVANDGDSINLSAPNSTTRRGRVGHRIANTIDTAALQATVIRDSIRRLTPIECERLQGFPDNWTIGSDTQRYKQCGNAVTVNVVEAVMKGLKECL